MAIEDSKAAKVLKLTNPKARPNGKSKPVKSTVQVLTDGQLAHNPYTFVVDDPGLVRGIRSGRIEVNRTSILRALSATPFTRDVFLGKTIMKHPVSGLRELDDNLVYSIASDLEAVGFASVPSRLVRECITAFAADNVVDSLVDWLKTLPPWDQVPRASVLFSRYFGVEQSEYTDAVSTYFVTALAGRAQDGAISRDGVKADCVPVLVSPQGWRKSSGIFAISPRPAWFGTLSFDHNDADRARLAMGKVILEIAELRGLKGRESEAIKAYLSQTYDSWIPKYCEHEIRYNRRYLCIGTSNQVEFLADSTGNRRWLPMKLIQKVDVDAIRADHAQIWAEALHLYQANGVIWHGVEEKALPYLEEHKLYNPRVEAIKNWVNQQTASAIPSQVIWQGAFPNTNFETRDGRIVADAMRELGGWRQKKSMRWAGMEGIFKGWEKE